MFDAQGKQQRVASAFAKDGGVWWKQEIAPGQPTFEQVYLANRCVILRLAVCVFVLWWGVCVGLRCGVVGLQFGGWCYGGCVMGGRRGSGSPGLAFPFPRTSDAHVRPSPPNPN